MTIKPYFTVKSLSVYAAVVLFITSVTGNIASGLGIGLMIGTTFMGYPFALGEKCGMDILYVTLSVNRKTVVLRRYIFTLALNACFALTVSALSVFGVIAGRALGLGQQTSGTFVIALALAALFTVVQAAQLPVLFRFGYSKAKFFGLIPFCVIMAAYSGIMSLAKSGNVWQTLAAIAAFISDNRETVSAVLILAVLIIVFVSYNVSLAFYKKREF
jgi:hypothetical protein